MLAKGWGALSQQGRMLAMLLVLMLVAFVAGHVMSTGATWNHVTGSTFSPWGNWVSDYAYRSPVWPLFVGCMHALAVGLAWISFRVFREVGTRPMIVWLMAVLLGYAALKLVEVATFPVKPPEITVEQLQSRMDAGSWQRLKSEIWVAYRNFRGWGGAQQGSAWDVVAAFQSNTGHMVGIRGGMSAILLAMTLGVFLPGGRLWIILSSLLLAIALVGGWGTRLELHGLFQRIAFIAIYGWMWLALVTFFRKRHGTGAEEAS